MNVREASAVRLTASDRPGVAQPVPVRDIPALPWGSMLLGAVALFALLMAAWEWHWRAFGVDTGYYRNSDGLWAMQRRRIDSGEGDATVIIGSSRLLFDTRLPTWERLSGRRPIQLALEGTSALPVLEDLADDAAFHGKLLVDVTPSLFFIGRAVRGATVKYAQKESPSQRVGQWLSMWIEPLLAFDDPDYAMVTVVERMGWPERAGKPTRIKVRKLSVGDADRNTRMWHKVFDDPEYQALARRIWTQNFQPPPDAPSPEEQARTLEDQIARAAKAVAKLKARGAEVVFVRAPCAGPYLEFEERAFPRARTWDVLLARSGAPGIHFEDYPEMQGLNLPEWSHLWPPDSERFTEALFRAYQGLAQRNPGAGASPPPG
jgi:hypothetical protein